MMYQVFTWQCCWSQCCLVWSSCQAYSGSHNILLDHPHVCGDHCYCHLIWLHGHLRVSLHSFLVFLSMNILIRELQYETRRKLYGSLTLGSPVSSVYITCYSLFRDTDFHTRFHFDHYEFSGQWHGN